MGKNDKGLTFWIDFTIEAYHDFGMSYSYSSEKITLYRIIFVIPSNDWVCGKDIHEYTFNAQNHWKRCMNVH